MTHAYEHAVDLFVAVIIMFLFPLLYFGLKQDALVQTIVSAETEALAGEIRSKGYLTKERYNLYLDNLSATGLLYDISMEHRIKIYEPEYRFRTAEEIIAEQNNSYTGVNDYKYRPVHTDIPPVSDPVNQGPLNTETNDSVLASSVNTPASANHTHEGACYGGHMHSATSENTFTHYHKHTSTCQYYISYVSLSGNCTNCDTYYQSYSYSAYWNAFTNSVEVNHSVHMNCPECDNSTHNNLKNLYSTGYSCYYEKDLDGDGDTDAMDTVTTYSFERTYPQVQSIEYETYNYKGEQETAYAPLRFDATSGCYSYHVHGRLPLAYGTYGAYYVGDPLGYMNRYGVNRFCEIPKTYEFVFKTKNDYGGNTQGRLTYETELLADGTMRYKLVGRSNYTGWDQLPQYMSFSQMSNLITPQEFVRFIQRHANINYFAGFDPYYYEVFVTCSLDTVKTCDPITSGLWELTCGKEQNATAHCDRIITSITPTHPKQTVAIGDPLITTVTASYLDGSSKVIVGSASFSTSSPVQNQTITITYTNIVGGISYSKTCTITVTVIPRSRTCTNDHTYNLNADGSDPGCPYCQTWLASLVITYPSSGSITIYKGTSLQDNGVALLATYMDGHTQHLHAEYIDNLDMEYVGSQNVTISYKGKYVNLTVITKRNLRLCSVCSRYYELYPDGSDPECPYCLALTPVFTGNVLEYYDEIYTDAILTELYEGSGIYFFTSKDYVTIRIKNDQGSLGRRFMSYFYKNLGKTSVQSVKGGYIREDGGK